MLFYERDLYVWGENVFFRSSTDLLCVLLHCCMCWVLQQLQYVQVQAKNPVIMSGGSVNV